MIKKGLCIILTLIMLFSFTACNFSGGEDAYLTFPIDSDPGYLDPQIASGNDAKNIIANCFEGLVTLDGEGQIAPGCAESWEISPDGLTYTFKLRKKMEWAVLTSSGDFLGEDFRDSFDASLTAHDFVFGLQRALLPETKSPGAQNLMSIKNAAEVNSGKLSKDKLGVRAEDDLTLVITLTIADPDFLHILLEPACMPCDEVFFKATGGRYGLSTRFLMYNGPFYMSNWADDTGFTLYRNDDYYGYDDVKPVSLYLSVNDEQSTRLSKIKDEIYDVAPLTAEQAQSIAKSRSYETLTFESGIYGLCFNCEDTYLSNANIRKAITATFDSKLFYSFIGEGTATGILPPSLLVSSNKYRDAAGEIKVGSSGNAKTFLEKGLNEIKEKDAEVTVLCTREQEEAIRSVMQVWQSSLGVSFNVFVEVATQDEIDRRVRENDNWQIALTSISFPYLTAFNGLMQFTTDKQGNTLNFSDKKYDNLVAKIKDASGKENTLAATIAAEKYLASQCPLIPLYNYPVYYGLGKGVEGVIFNNTGDVLYFRETTVK